MQEKIKWGMPSVQRHGQNGCGCFTENTMDRPDPMFLIQNPDILPQMISADPVVRKTAYCDVRFLTKPVNFQSKRDAARVPRVARRV